MEKEERTRELLLLLVTAGMGVGRCNGEKLLFLVAAGMEVGWHGAFQHQAWMLIKFIETNLLDMCYTVCLTSA